jgi:hypothetical protein
MNDVKWKSGCDVVCQPTYVHEFKEGEPYLGPIDGARVSEAAGNEPENGIPEIVPRTL